MSEYIEHDKTRNSVGLVVKKYFTFAEPPDFMTLDSNEKIGPVIPAIITRYIRFNTKNTYKLSHML